MRYLRTVPTRRLLAMIAGLIAAIAAGTTLAVAASSGGPVPKRESLAAAIRQALAAPMVQGITARITFTNHLIDASNLQGSDPILTGASGRLWLSPGHGLRLELQGNNGDGQIVVNNGSFWVYDPSSNTVYEGKVPAGAGGAARDAADKKAGQHALPTMAQIQTELSHLAQHLNLSGAIPSDVAGQPAYTVRVTPQHDGGLLGAAALAWDALRGLPLRVAVYARNDSNPVLELKATKISYGAVAASVFRVSPPPSAKVVKVSSPASDTGASANKDANAKSKSKKRHPKVTGVAAVARHLSFKLRAPASLVGLPRRSVTLLDWGGTPAALVTYGQGLGGIAVIEQTARSAKTLPQTASSGDRRGLSLPTISIHGVTGQELDTALGTVVRFTRGGVAYTVLGSVPPVAADLAARSL